MNAAPVQELLAAAPFQPFELILVDERKFTVDHPDLVTLSAPARVLTIYNESGATEIVNLLVVSSIKLQQAQLAISP